MNDLSTQMLSFELPSLQFLLCVDHTTVENLGQQNAFLSSLNTIIPGSLSSSVPVFSHDQKKNNWQATKIVAKNIIDQLNQMVGNPEPIRLLVRPLPSDHVLPELDPAYVELEMFFETCHKHLTDSSWCTSCFASQDDSKNNNFNSRNFKCPFACCNVQSDLKSEIDQHVLIDHTDVHARKRKRNFEDFDDRLQKYYKRSHMNSVSKTWATSHPINIGVNRKLNQKAEPDLLDCIKEVVDIQKFYE